MSEGGIGRYFLSPPGRGGGYERLPRLLRGGRSWRYCLLLLIGVLQSGAAVILTLSIKALFETVSLQASAMPWGSVAIAIAALLCGALLRWREYVEAERLAQDYVHAVRTTIFRHALRLGAEGLEQTSRSAILLRFTGDLAPLRQWIGRGLSRGVVGSVTIIVTVGALLVLDPFIGAAIGVAMLITAAGAFAVGPGLETSTREVRRRRTILLRHVQQRLARIAVIEAHGDEKEERKQIQARSRRLQASAVSQAAHSGVLRALGEAGASAASLCAVVSGVLLAGLGLTTPGGIIAAVLVAGLVAPKVQDVARAFEHWTAARIAVEKLAAFLALRPVGRMKGSSPASQRLTTATGRLELKNVGYRDIVSDLSLTIEPGKLVWVSSQMSPHQKSVLLRLAAGVVQPSSGEVTLDGVNLSQLHRGDTRRHIALASAGLEHLPGTLRDSVMYGVEPALKPMLDTLIGQHDLRDYFGSLRDGLDHVIGEAGANIGAAQRLVAGLLRARLMDARIILLDQGEVLLGQADVRAIQSLLSDFQGGVLWVSAEEPKLPRYSQYVH